MVEGSLEQPDLGISEENLQSITNNVAVVFHIAATVKFDAHIRLYYIVKCHCYPLLCVIATPSIMCHYYLLSCVSIILQKRLEALF